MNDLTLLFFQFPRKPISFILNVLKYLLSALFFSMAGNKSTFFPSFFNFFTNEFIAFCLFSSTYSYSIPKYFELV